MTNDFSSANAPLHSTTTTPCQTLVTMREVRYRRHHKDLLDGVNLRLNRQGITTLIGANGAGKSLLLQMMTGLLQPDSGTIDYNQAAGFKRTSIALVMQQPVFLRRTVLDNLLHTLALRPLGNKRQQYDQAWQWLAIAKLSDLAKRPARALSGGEQQKLAIVRAMALAPKLLLLDEPTSKLDPSASHDLEAFIRTISAQQDIKVLLVSHNPGQIRRLSDSFYFIHQGKILEYGTGTSALNQPQTPQLDAYMQGNL